MGEGRSSHSRFIVDRFLRSNGFFRSFLPFLSLSLSLSLSLTHTHTHTHIATWRYASKVSNGVSAKFSTRSFHFLILNTRFFLSPEFINTWTFESARSMIFTYANLNTTHRTMNMIGVNVSYHSFLNLTKLEYCNFLFNDRRLRYLYETTNFSITLRVSIARLFIFQLSSRLNRNCTFRYHQSYCQKQPLFLERRFQLQTLRVSHD